MRAKTEYMEKRIAELIEDRDEWKGRFDEMYNSSARIADAADELSAKLLEARSRIKVLEDDRERMDWLCNQSPHLRGALDAALAASRRDELRQKQLNCNICHGSGKLLAGWQPTVDHAMIALGRYVDCSCREKA